MVQRRLVTVLAGACHLVRPGPVPVVAQPDRFLLAVEEEHARVQVDPGRMIPSHLREEGFHPACGIVVEGFAAISVEDRADLHLSLVPVPGSTRRRDAREAPHAQGVAVQEDEGRLHPGGQLCLDVTARPDRVVPRGQSLGAVDADVFPQVMRDERSGGRVPVGEEDDGDAGVQEAQAGGGDERHAEVDVVSPGHDVDRGPGRAGARPILVRHRHPGSSGGRTPCSLRPHRPRRVARGRGSRLNSACGSRPPRGTCSGGSCRPRAFRFPLHDSNPCGFMTSTRHLRDLARRMLGRTRPRPDKYALEENFWRIEIDRILAWYRGEREVHYRTPAPAPEDRVQHRDPRLAAILTWFELHQKPKYLLDLSLPPDAFRGMRVLDVGSGPMPSGEAFAECELYCLDPLFPRYLNAGWPLHLYRSGTRFVHGYAESMPLEDESCGAVISVNAIDHVDDFQAAAAEIRRVLRPGGELCMHVHYHPPTGTEPLELDDEAVVQAFGWCERLEKRSESHQKSSALAAEGESYVLWSTIEP
ncbi:MAG: class I SAM-dependent methyltransferase [Gemmatimonadales bacterium]|nr:MAG: class I SAM-dependent methyltransferase [Gemmatimonadales bacterium]